MPTHRCCVKQIPVLAGALWVLVFLGACSTGNVQRAANQYGLIQEVASGTLFKHQVLRKHGKGKLLHVYIEGDGRPWRNRRNISLDPTPKHLLMLDLMALDPAPAIYVGRPCYFGLSDKNCSPEWWTSKRYAREVVASLNHVIEKYAKAYDGVLLFGHSGGGTLVMLLAALRSDTLAVTTLAGNLDIEKWARSHRYSLLQGSANPATQPTLSEKILQRHYLGALDTNITADMLGAAVARQPGAELIVLENIDHSCCWQQLWPELLRDGEQALSGRSAGAQHSPGPRGRALKLKAHTGGD